MIFRIGSTLMAAITILSSCSSSTSKTEYQKSFQKQWQLSLPAHFNSNQHSQIKEPLPDSVKDAAFTRAQLFEDENVLTSIVFYRGDDQIPMIFTADKNGKEVDKHSLFESVSETADSKSIEDVTILADHTIASIDSTWKAEKLTVTKKKFRINVSGQFEQFDMSVTMF